MGPQTLARVQLANYYSLWKDQASFIKCQFRDRHNWFCVFCISLELTITTNWKNLIKQSQKSIFYLTSKEKVLQGLHPSLWSHLYTQQPRDAWCPSSPSVSAKILVFGLISLLKWQSKTYTKPSHLSSHSHN